MSTGLPPVPGPALVTIYEDLQTLQRNWFWVLLLGIGLVLVGMLAIGSSFVATLATVIVFGWFTIAGGIIYLVGLVWTRTWGGFFLQMLAGILSLVLGLFMVGEPVRFAVVYTLLMAILFIVQGGLRIVASLAGRFQGWVWVLISGVITLSLGILIWRELPYSGLEVIGLFVGIDLLFSGVSHIVTALTVRGLPLNRAGPTAAV